jgi:queuosine precursor transporter
MINEVVFFIHIAVVISLILLSLRFFGERALIALVAIQAILANLFVIKQITLFGFTVTCSDVFIIGSAYCINLLNEYFGKKSAKMAVNISFVACVFYLIMTKIHLLYIPSNFDQFHASYENILQFTPRIIFASILAYFVSGYFDVYFYNFLKKVFRKEDLLKKMGFSLIISQFIDTIIFGFIALYGIVNSIIDVMMVSFCIKMCTITLSAPFISLSKKIAPEKKST